VEGKRRQYPKRFATEKEARDALEEIRGEVARGTYVHPARTTVAQACGSPTRYYQLLNRLLVTERAMA
jgi:hypothetical protein